MTPSAGSPPEPAPAPAPAPRPRGVLARVRNRIAASIGVTPAMRFETARAMLARHGTDRIGYWLQLVLSMGIATYGLVLGSTGVVIGAMLVSPLMGPLVEIGMGLVVGSPLLVIHSVLRTALSVVLVVALSATLTLALPYHEATAEILSRTSPTLLDLYVASFCALAAAYTTVRQGSDTVTAAAGTAISIALVPPLCVVGWGLGARDAQAWHGAMLLFTANFCAIILFSVVVFALLAYDTVDSVALEQSAQHVPTRGDRFASRLREVFGSKYGPALRLLMPLLFAAAVFVPLRSALNEVAWTVTTRAGIQQVLDALPPAKRAVRSVVSVDRHAVSVQLLIVGDNQSAETLKHTLETKIAAVSGVVPSVDVMAVPDVEEVRLATRSLTPQPIVAPPKPDIGLVEHDLDAELRSKWPAGTVGDLLTWRMVVGPGGADVVEVVHFGNALGAAGEAILAEAISKRVGRDLKMKDVALTESVVSVAPELVLEWLPSMSHAVDQAVASGVAYVCVTSASGVMKSAAKGEPKGDTHDYAAMADQQIQQALARLPPGRSTVRPGHEWSVALSATACPPGPAAPASAEPAASAPPPPAPPPPPPPTTTTTTTDAGIEAPADAAAGG